MNGALSLMQTAAAAGIELCLANPGTTELPLVAALDQVRGIRAVLGLFEGVCTGAADGYARMTGRPALTLLHHGPGFANGIANLHNAQRARVPVVSLIGEHATWHLDADPPGWYIPVDIGFHIDEGYKTLDAKNRTVFETTHWNANDDYPGWSKGSPFTQQSYYLAFKTFGLQLSSARLVSVFFFILFLVLIKRLSMENTRASTAHTGSR